MNLASGRDMILTSYKEGPSLLERAIEDLDDAALDAHPPGGGWTIRQIVHHVVDGDTIWTPCIKAALGSPKGEFSLQWYGSHPQDEWAEHWEYARRAIGPSLELLRANRNQVIQLLTQATDAWGHTIGVRLASGELRVLSVETIMEMQADHIPHHVKRIREIRGKG